MILYITLYYILFDIKLCYGILTGDCTQQPVDEAVQHKKVFLYSVRVCVHAYAHTHTHVLRTQLEHRMWAFTFPYIRSYKRKLEPE